MVIQVSKNLSKVDRQTMDSVAHVSEYCPSIQRVMLRRERKWEVASDYMQGQESIDETMRATLVDWLVQQHYNFKLLPETLFLTANIIDRYFAQT